MDEKIYDPFEESKRNRWPKIGIIYSKEDVSNVWQCLGQWIGENLIAHRIIKIHNFGTFALSNWKLETGIRKYCYNNRPTFSISQKLLNDYELNQTKEFILDKGPVLLINYCVLSQLTSFDRVKVEACIQEVILALSRLLYKGKNINLTIPGLGTLSIINKEVKFDYNVDISARIKPTPPEQVQKLCPRKDRLYQPPPYKCPYINAKNEHSYYRT